MAQVLLLRSFVSTFFRRQGGKSVLVPAHTNRVVKAPDEARAPRTRFSSLADVHRFADSIGVELEASEADDIVLLHDIGRVGGEKGLGAKVMHALCVFADSHDKPIALEALHDNPKLIQYYRQFGFKEDKTRPPIENDGTLMVRVPQPLAKALVVFLPPTIRLGRDRS